METLYSRTLQIQFIETVAVEILNIQRSDIPQSHAELTEVRSDSLFDVIYISRISVYLHRVFNNTQPLDHVVGEKDVAGNGRLRLRLGMNYRVLISTSGLCQQRLGLLQILFSALRNARRNPFSLAGAGVGPHVQHNIVITFLGLQMTRYHNYLLFCSGITYLPMADLLYHLPVSTPMCFKTLF